MRAAWIALVLLMVATPALAQTATPSPAPTGSPPAANATLGALPTYSAAGVLPTLTPFPTANWPTLTPNPNTVPLPAPPYIRTAQAIGDSLSAGQPFPIEQMPPPALRNPNIPVVDDIGPGFDAINTLNLGELMAYMTGLAILFYEWLFTNFPRLIVGARWFVIILMVLYGIFWLWKGSRFGPPDQETRDLLDEPGAFFNSFSQGSRFYYYTRGNRIRERRRARDVDKAWGMAEREDASRVYRAAEAENRRMDAEQRAAERRLARNERIAKRQIERMNARDAMKANREQARQERIAKRELKRRGR